MTQKAPQTGPVDPSDDLAVYAPRVDEGRADVVDVKAEQVDVKEDGKEGPKEIQKDIDAQQKAARSNEGHRLDVAQEKSLLLKLAARFKSNEFLHKGVEWARVKASLKADPEALWSINNLEKAGHKPDVYNADNEGFDIGTAIKECSKIPGKVARGCVYSEADVQKYKSQGFEGVSAATEGAKSMGTELMDPVLYYKKFLESGFDKESECWLSTPPRIRDKGEAIYGFNVEKAVVVPRDILLTLLPDGSLSEEESPKYNLFNGPTTVYDYVTNPGKVVISHEGPEYNRGDYERRVSPGPNLIKSPTSWYQDSLYWRGTKRVKWAA